jgi:mannose-6-phosphate isomerase-like protein (cupin superfamily)
MSEYPRTIDNGAGEKLTFLGVRSDERGKYLEARNTVQPGSGPPMHVHRRQEESLAVERGTMGWQRLGEEEQVAGPGETVTFAPGEMHRFWNAGRDELVCNGYVRPPDNLEYVLTQLFASTRANGGKRPRLFDAAYLLSRYRSEFGMADVSAPVQRFVFPVVVAIGAASRARSRFPGAPEPVK